MLHAQDAASLGYKRILAKCCDTGRLMLLLHDIEDSNTEVWMLPGEARVMK